MTTYNAAKVADAVIAYQKGITLQQGRALRDNPLAQAEGATGAPYIQQAWHPYNGVTVGDGNTGLVYDSTVSGVVASVETPNFVDGYEYRLRFVRLSHNDGGSQSLTFLLWRETSAAWTAASSISVAVNNAAPLNGFTEIYRPRMNERYTSTFAAIGGTSNCDAVDLTTAQKVLKAAILFTAGSIDSGTIHMQRRRCYA